MIRPFRTPLPIRHPALAAAGLLLGLAMLLPGAARASCGASSCEMHSAHRPQGPRSLRFAYDYELVPQETRWAGKGPAPAGVPGGQHDELGSVSQTHRLSAELGLSRRWSLALQVPFVARTHSHVHHHDDEDMLDSWSVSGMGDVQAEARWVAWSRPGGSSWVLGAAVELPTGRRHAVNDDGEEAETGILPGSGSWDGSLSLAWSRPAGRATLFASAARRFNGRGELGYRIGGVSMLHAGASARLGRGWTGMLQLNAVRREKDDKGSTGEDTADTGGEALYVSPGLELELGGPWLLTAAVQLPLYQRVNGYQLVADFGLRTGLAWRFTPAGRDD